MTMIAAATLPFMLYGSTNMHLTSVMHSRSLTSHFVCMCIIHTISISTSTLSGSEFGQHRSRRLVCLQHGHQKPRAFLTRREYKSLKTSSLGLGDLGQSYLKTVPLSSVCLIVPSHRYVMNKFNSISKVIFIDLARTVFFRAHIRSMIILYVLPHNSRPLHTCQGISSSARDPKVIRRAGL